MTQRESSNEAGSSSTMGLLVLRALGALLSYPRQEMREALPEIVGVVRSSPLIVPREGDGRAVLDQVGLSVAQVEEMHRYLAIANYEDRFVIPTSHREQAEDAYGLRGSCGFTFGNGCDFGPPHSSLFGGKMGRRKVVPIRRVDT